MMSKKQWFVLLCLLCLYLLLGAAIFFYIESQEEIKKHSIELVEIQRIDELLKKHYKGDNKSMENILNRLSNYCGKPVYFDMSQMELECKWDFYHSLFFVITVVSTIGYGNLAPTTMFTRIFMIFYGLIGIPMNGIVMVTMGEYFGKSFKNLYRRWKSSSIERSAAKFGLIGQIILYSVPGLTFFIFLPSTIIGVFEGWNYDVAVYYAFVTLTTIGFGDFVAGNKNVSEFGPLVMYFYKIFLLVWVIGGIGYVVMIIGFITQGMRSRKVAKIEKILAENIRKTPTKIRKELRSLLQEFLFMRVKPVYKGEFDYTPHYLERTQSCPDLTMWRNKNSPSMARKRAMSECYKLAVLEKVPSDTELEKIDKERTFKPSAELMKQKDFILKVVDALSMASTSSAGEQGINGFSDPQILASEQYEDTVFTPQRRRAVSDIKPPTISDYLSAQAANSFTWYGSEASKALYEFKQRRALSIPAAGEKVQRPTILQRIKNRFKFNDGKVPDIEKHVIDDSPDKTRPNDVDDRRQSILSARNEHLLEKTSIADFIRALTAISAPDEYLEPRRKLGTASVTPPTPKIRKKSILPNLNSRRTSLIPPFHAPISGRRFSLRPVDENLLCLPPPYSPTNQGLRSSFKGANRRFSVRPTSTVNFSTATNSPVKSQVHRRKRTESEDDCLDK